MRGSQTLRVSHLQVIWKPFLIKYMVGWHPGKASTFLERSRCANRKPVRANFNDLHVFEEYLRGYRIFRTFFAAHMWVSCAQPRLCENLGTSSIILQSAGVWKDSASRCRWYLLADDYTSVGFYFRVFAVEHKQQVLRFRHFIPRLITLMLEIDAKAGVIPLSQVSQIWRRQVASFSGPRHTERLLIMRCDILCISLMFDYLVSYSTGQVLKLDSLQTNMSVLCPRPIS